MSNSHYGPPSPTQDDSLPRYAMDFTLPSYDDTIRADLWEMRAYRALQQERDLESGDIESEGQRLHSGQTSLDFSNILTVPASVYLPFESPPRYEGRRRQAAPAAQLRVPARSNASEPSHAVPASDVPSPTVATSWTNTNRACREDAAAGTSSRAGMLPLRYYWSRQEPPAPTPEETPTEAVDYVVFTATAGPSNSTRIQLGSRRGVFGMSWGLCKVLASLGSIIAFVIVLAVVDETVRKPLRDADSQ